MTPHGVDFFLAHHMAVGAGLCGEAGRDPRDAIGEGLLLRLAAQLSLERLDDGLGHSHLAPCGQFPGQRTRAVVTDLQRHDRTPWWMEPAIHTSLYRYPYAGCED